MSRQAYHTVPPLSEQLRATIEQRWQEDVVSRLPADYEAQAYQLGAFERERELKRPAEVLRALLAYVICPLSFRQLGCWAVLIGMANLSDNAWRKRLRQSRAWLLWMLSELLTPGTPVVPLVPISPEVRSVKLIDATRLKQPGGCGDDWRLHIAYDLLAGRLVQVSISDRHGAESFSRFVLQPGDVAVGDMGYGYRVCVAYALGQKAHAIVRICPSTFPLQEEQGKAIDVVSWLKQQGPGSHGRQVWFEHQGQRFQVRLIAQALNEEAAERARAAKKRKASKKQRVLSEETLFLAGWVLLISTVPQTTWSDDEVLRLYRARWQIELLFKRMKQVLRLKQLRGKTPETNEASILALLLVWALHEQDAQQSRAVLDDLSRSVEPLEASSASIEEGLQEAALSQWLLTAVELQTLRVVIQGSWSFQRLHRCLPHLQRFFRGSPRKRRQQEQTIRRWLCSQAVA